MNEINQKLISIGNDIIKDNPNNPKLNNSNINDINNNMNILDNAATTTIPEKEKEIIINHQINNNSNLNSYNRNFFLHSNYNPIETKKSSYSNISKLNYKDGIILKDANNSNPGFGLWAVKLSEEAKPRKKLEEKDDNNNSINTYNSNIFSNKLFNNVNNIKLNEKNISDSNLDTIDYFDPNAYEGEVDKVIINKLTRRSNKVEKKYKDILIKYYDRENLYLNLEKQKLEYEQLIKDSVKEKEEIRKNCEKLDNNNQALVNSIANARKEIERLVVVIKEEQSKIIEEIEKYNKNLVLEEEKRKKIINQIKYAERQICILQDKIEIDKKTENNNNNTNNTNGTDTSRDCNKTTKTNNFDIDKSKLLFDEHTIQFYKIKKETKREKELKINRKKEYIKKLQEELEKLKIEDEEKLKEKRELFQLINDKNYNKKIYQNNMDLMLNELEKQERKNKWNNNTIKINRNIIQSLKKHSNSQ